MCRINILLLGFLLCFLKVKAQEVKFLKEYHRFNIDTTVKVTVPFKGDFYCLKSNGQVFVINSGTGLIDPSYQDNSKDVKLKDLLLKNDSLIGLSNTKNHYYLNKNEWIPLKETLGNSPIFEDDKYVVISTCSGEWGGSLYFRDKKTNKLYECESTCTVSLVKKDSKYYVTASLGHLSGFTDLFEIDDPSKLKVYNRDEILKKKANAKKKKITYVSYVGEDESRSEEGKTQLADSIGVVAVSSFLYNSNFFYLVAKHGRTFITSIQNKKLVTLDEIELKTDYYTSINRNYPDQTICNFRDDETSGFIAIQNNKIVTYLFIYAHE